MWMPAALQLQPWVVQLTVIRLRGNRSQTSDSDMTQRATSSRSSPFSSGFESCCARLSAVVGSYQVEAVGVIIGLMGRIGLIRGGRSNSLPLVQDDSRPGRPARGFF